MTEDIAKYIFGMKNFPPRFGTQKARSFSLLDGIE